MGLLHMKQFCILHSCLYFSNIFFRINFTIVFFVRKVEINLKSVFACLFNLNEIEVVFHSFLILNLYPLNTLVLGSNIFFTPKGNLFWDDFHRNFFSANSTNSLNCVLTYKEIVIEMKHQSNTNKLRNAKVSLKPWTNKTHVPIKQKQFIF